MYFETECVIAVYSESRLLVQLVGFTTNRKCVCNFLLVIILNVGPLLPRFRNIEDFLLKPTTPSLFHPIFGAFISLGLDRRCCKERRPYTKLSCCLSNIGCVINFVITFLIWDHDTQRHGRTDGRTTYGSNTALYTIRTCIWDGRSVDNISTNVFNVCVLHFAAY